VPRRNVTFVRLGRERFERCETRNEDDWAASVPATS
jgi:hypothetical protein